MNTFVLYFHDKDVFERARKKVDIRNLRFLLNNLDPAAASDIAVIQGFCVTCETFKQFKAFLKKHSHALLVTESVLDADIEKDENRSPVPVRVATLDELRHGFCLD